jgi:protein-disulfide isomerase
MTRSLHAFVPAWIAITLLACASMRASALPPEDPSAGQPQAPARPTVQADAERIPVGNSPTRGRADAMVTVVEFGDFQCPFCTRAEPTIDTLRERYGNDLRLVWKNVPLPNHPNAMTAAEAAMEVYAQRGADAFFRFHDLLFAHQDSLGRDELLQYAQALGVDTARFTQALDAHTHLPEIERDMALATQLGVDGTPVFYVNGTLIAGARPLSTFVSVIEAVVARARTIASRDQVYATMVLDPVPAPPEPPRARARRRRPEPDLTVRHRVPIEGAPSAGRDTALVTIVEFSDFECPYCAAAEPTIASLRQRYGHELRIVWRDLPSGRHPNAHLAAEAAREAFAQRGSTAFFRFHDALFAHQTDPGGLERVALQEYAREGGLDLVRFRNALDGHVHNPSIEQDRALGDALGIDGTPTFFVNGMRIVGARPESEFVELIDREMAYAREAIAHGATRAGVYDAVTGQGARAAVY